jgi:hypothetical protein
VVIASSLDFPAGRDTQLAQNLTGTAQREGLPRI